MLKVIKGLARATAVVMCGLVCCLVLAGGVGATGSVRLAKGTSARIGTVIPTNQWPEAHGNQQLTGLSGDTSVSTANAAQLGVR